MHLWTLAFVAVCALSFARGQVVAAAAAEAGRILVDLSRTNGTVRPLHGINKGPITSGGTIDLSERFRAFNSPITRLHDAQFPYSDVVDIHAIFRNPEADPGKPESYDFVLTDDYLASINRLGIKIVYRLGETIEHGAVKRYVNPPPDPEKWADACLGIIRHYNEGWANGTHYGIEYWEIWNEPENRPAMWTGTDEQFFALYKITAKKIKAAWPSLKVGGPSLGYYGSFENDAASGRKRFLPSPFTTNFLELCRSEQVPLDFFSWHCYTDDPSELVLRARAVRALLDQHGFARTESHLNEWNFLPHMDWNGISKTAKPEFRQAWREEMGGPAGAAFVTAALIGLQDAPVDVCNFYHAELGVFGLFNEDGVPNRVFEALVAFNSVARLPLRVTVEGEGPGKIAVLSSRSANFEKGAILVSNYDTKVAELALAIRTAGHAYAYELWQLTATQPWHKAGNGMVNDPATAVVKLQLPSPGVALLLLTETR